MSNINKVLDAMKNLEEELREIPEINKFDLKLGINPNDGKYAINILYTINPKLTGLKALHSPSFYKGFYLVAEKLDTK